MTMHLFSFSWNLTFFQTTQTLLFCDCNVVCDCSLILPLTLSSFALASFLRSVRVGYGPITVLSAVGPCVPYNGQTAKEQMVEVEMRHSLRINNGGST